MKERKLVAKELREVIEQIRNEGYPNLQNDEQVAKCILIFGMKLRHLAKLFDESI